MSKGIDLDAVAENVRRTIVQSSGVDREIVDEVINAMQRVHVSMIRQERLSEIYEILRGRLSKDEKEALKKFGTRRL